MLAATQFLEGEGVWGVAAASHLMLRGAASRDAPLTVLGLPMANTELPVCHRRTDLPIREIAFHSPGPVRELSRLAFGSRFARAEGSPDLTRSADNL